MKPMLEVRNLRIAYGGINAVKGIDLDVNEGEVVALIGANGAGKTTTLKALTGLAPVAEGHVHYRGRSITRRPPHELVREGIALVPEGRGIFGRLKVEENLAIGAYCRSDVEVSSDLERVYGLFPRLAERRTQLAGTLSGGEQQMLAIGRALMSRPRLLLLDEPSMGLAPILVQRIFEVIRSIARDGGVTLLLVEQNARLALQVSDRGYVMESGCIALSDRCADLLANPRVQAAYLGD
jgi:branched-chain amino acid transport system ATP-binding protein